MGGGGHIVNGILIHYCVAQNIQWSVRLMGVIDLTQLNLTNDSKDAGKTSSEKVSFLVYALDDQIYLLKVFCFCWLVFYIREYFFGIIGPVFEQYVIWGLLIFIMY